MTNDPLYYEPQKTDPATGRSPFGRMGLQPWYKPLRETVSVDVAIVGGGISGALIAEHLTARGYSVAVIDRDEASLASTAASTAMLRWELDTSLSDLSFHNGFEKASALYRRSVVAVSSLGKLVERLNIACGFRRRSSLSLANSPGSARELQQEAALRKRAGLPGDYLSHPYLMADFEIERDGGILSPGAAEADPLLLAWGLLSVAVSRGALLVKAAVTRIGTDAQGAEIATEGSHGLRARHVVLATGHAMPGIAMPKAHRVTSSWALATVPQHPGRLWRDRAFLWEGSTPSLFLRTSEDNRIIVGGEDEAIGAPAQRDAMIAQKVEILRDRLQRLWPQAESSVAYRWAGTFGETEDGLPMIGPVPGADNLFAAYGYGRNGMGFAFMAALMIGAMVAGERRDWFDDFALDREGPAYRGLGGAPAAEARSLQA